MSMTCVSHTKAGYTHSVDDMPAPRGKSVVYTISLECNFTDRAVDTTYSKYVSMKDAFFLCTGLLSYVRRGLVRAGWLSFFINVDLVAASWSFNRLVVLPTGYVSVTFTDLL